MNKQIGLKKESCIINQNGFFRNAILLNLSNYLRIANVYVVYHVDRFPFSCNRGKDRILGIFVDYVSAVEFILEQCKGQLIGNIQNMYQYYDDMRNCDEYILFNGLPYKHELFDIIEGYKFGSVNCAMLYQFYKKYNVNYDDITKDFGIEKMRNSCLKN